MRHSLSGFDDRDDGFRLVGEERVDEFSGRDRRLPAILLTVLAMALFAGGLWFAYVQGTRHPAVSAQGDSVPLIRADTRPEKVKPDQPGGMNIPDQNVSIYNEKPGAPAMEKLLPQAEQPMPRPAPAAAAAPSSTATATPPVAATPPLATSAPAKPAAKPAAHAAPAAAPKAPTQPKQAAAAAATSPHAGTSSPVQVRLASLRSPEAAREEWARLKRENPDLLGKLTANAIRTDLGDRGVYYRVEAGPLADAAAAERLCGELKRRKFGCVVAR